MPSRLAAAPLLPPAYLRTIEAARQLCDEHGETPLVVGEDGATQLPDGTTSRLTHDQLYELAHQYLHDHQHVMQSHRPQYAAYCTGCPPPSDYLRCEYAAWARSWLLWEYAAHHDGGLPHGSAFDDGYEWADGDGLHIRIDIGRPPGHADLYVDAIDGDACAPGARLYSRTDLLRSEIGRIQLLHTPIGPAEQRGDQALADRLCRECVRKARLLQRYDRCEWRIWAAGWRAAPDWLWDCIGKPIRGWPDIARTRYFQGIDTPIEPRRRRQPRPDPSLNNMPNTPGAQQCAQPDAAFIETSATEPSRSGSDQPAGRPAGPFQSHQKERP